MSPPKVVVNGQDHRTWPSQTAKNLSPLPSAQAPSLDLSRNGYQATARIGPRTSGTSLAAYWAVLQDGLDSKITRGENAGTDLRHDYVVRLYQPPAAWSATQAHTAQHTLPADATGQRVAFVVTDSRLTRPVQALALRCS